jgi:hypothetical protein
MPDKLKPFKLRSSRLKSSRLKSPRLKSFDGPPNTIMEGVKPKTKTREELLQELELDRIKLKPTGAETRRREEERELDFILNTNLKKKG